MLGATLPGVMPQLSILLLWLIVGFALALKLCRWR
jgi:hypothetical protein